MYQVYWLHLNVHKDPVVDGYVGITKQTHKYKGRTASHLRFLKNGSHNNPKLQNAFNKYKEIQTTILLEGDKKECILYERKLRPVANVAWNIMEGGNIPPSQVGKHWFTNGSMNRLTFDCPVGFHAGRTQKSGADHGHYGKPKNYKVKFSKEFLAQQKMPPWNAKGTN